MKNVQIGCGQITWKGAAADRALAEIAEAEYAGAPAGPQNGMTTAEVLAQFERYGLRPAPGYLGADFWQPELEEEILARAVEYAKFAGEAGCTELYVTAGGFTSYTTARGLTRAQVAGHMTTAEADNPPCGGLSADKTDSLVWREVIRGFTNAGSPESFYRSMSKREKRTEQNLPQNHNTMRSPQ